MPLDSRCFLSVLKHERLHRNKRIASSTWNMKCGLILGKVHFLKSTSQEVFFQKQKNKVQKLENN